MFVMLLPVAYAVGALLRLTGEGPTVHFGALGASDKLTLIHNASEDKLTCSGEFEASDVRIAGTDMTVAQLMTEFTTMKAQMAHVLKMVAFITPPPMMPPPSMPPSPPSWQHFTNLHCIATQSEVNSRPAGAYASVTEPSLVSYQQVSLGECKASCADRTDCVAVEVHSSLTTDDASLVSSCALMYVCSSLSSWQGASVWKV